MARVGVRFAVLATLDGENMITIDGPMSVIRGDSAAYRITVTDDADERVDLGDLDAIELEIKAELGGADPAAISKAIDAGITLLDQTDPETKGQADIEITADDTKALSVGVYWLDVVVIEGDDRQHVIAPLEYVVRNTVNLP